MAHCHETACPLFVDGKPLYRDGDHLSKAGALRLAPVLRDEVLAEEAGVS